MRFFAQFNKQTGEIFHILESSDCPGKTNELPDDFIEITDELRVKSLEAASDVYLSRILDLQTKQIRNDISKLI